ncbi:MAG: cell envelope integrity protein TolA [Candidatus Solibacter usitatus]|nr:cell envelope integrity protein TolA [Candidatus Solibacter usitatus]
MARHLDVLDERDSLRSPLLGSLVLHAAVFGTLAVMAFTHIGKRTPWGDPNSMGGGAFSVSAVKSIPIPGRTGPVNRVASDTESQIPEPVKKDTKKAVKDDRDAIALKSKKSPKIDRAERWAANRRDPREYADNQVFSRGGQAATSPLYNMLPGSGGVGVGTGAPFGAMCGAYSVLVRDRVAGRWRTDHIDGRIRTLPAAIVTFELMRTGQVSRIRVTQSSGNVALDYSAQRAVTEASPFEPVPPNCPGNPAVVEFWFQLKR